MLDPERGVTRRQLHSRLGIICYGCHLHMMAMACVWGKGGGGRNPSFSPAPVLEFLNNLWGLGTE